MEEPEINLGEIILYSKLIQMKGKIILLSKCMGRWKQIIRHNWFDYDEIQKELEKNVQGG